MLAFAYNIILYSEIEVTSVVCQTRSLTRVKAGGNQLLLSLVMVYVKQFKLGRWRRWNLKTQGKAYALDGIIY